MKSIPWDASTRAREVAARTFALNPSDETTVADLSDSYLEGNRRPPRGRAEVIDSYLASLPPEKRNTLGNARRRKCYLLWYSRDFTIGLQKLIESMPAEAWNNPWTRLEFMGA